MLRYGLGYEFGAVTAVTALRVYEHLPRRMIDSGMSEGMSQHRPGSYTRLKPVRNSLCIVHLVLVTLSSVKRLRSPSIEPFLGLGFHTPFVQAVRP